MRWLFWYIWDMKLTLIKNLFSRKLSKIEFKEIVSQEMIEYISKWKNRGSSRSVYLVEDTEVYIGGQEAIFLLDSFIKTELSILEINYIVDALLLSEKVKFESEEFLEEFETMTDPEIHGVFTLESAIRLKTYFSK